MASPSKGPAEAREVREVGARAVGYWQHVRKGERADAEVGTRRDSARVGRTHTNFGRTAGSLDSDVVAPTADPRIGLDKAGALSKTKGMVDPGPPKGPRREAVATTGFQRGA